MTIFRKLGPIQDLVFSAELLVPDIQSGINLRKFHESLRKGERSFISVLHLRKPISSFHSGGYLEPDIVKSLPDIFWAICPRDSCPFFRAEKVRLPILNSLDHLHVGLVRCLKEKIKQNPGMGHVLTKTACPPGFVLEGVLDNSEHPATGPDVRSRTRGYSMNA